MFEAIMFPSAAVLYAWAIIGEHVQKELRRWSLRMFCCAVAIDASATLLVCIVRTGVSVWPATLHGQLGYAALAIMMIHAIWAYRAYARSGDALARFHRWSPWAGMLWLAAFVSGIPR
ncbi:MAG: hypothetical protein A3J07_04880 [Candidatus Doudnabacteria bacterium RIFCSPLOWO2_02_FULL_49_13]|uniref:TIGR03987 family protein n=1 Tax=Candidatus Doudnabacteria bacterium RIFCSPHIGHO2_12_FULL_48_16 TaxID=1817838 RepID=A0A1F5PKK6_9BACT|nr:MAG: hypothetical protein A3B77_04520 [Candidatus Doudnabacteria bacterium RIFCSPHIGHO2_02_FULL_49_24]OGE88154.1 MAG: hypothetical protein A2760_02170 [Candidatus Doudnabacteria bacterium RIFCSPHIGHO2_01_FULL_50_67]OGE90463.1 MAG: hypothetical protein A3E29_04950 [Candidatus Doudnabacteria bacterium RIFCSPHIGHO2_12_FULL_48_16]OGE96525.1 MAG: hypothetical protein A2990_03395 [Candidatus Doudnabacteria bacterium RIFCSPLOWO2_01_FULL_49_40]OGF02699.1 MAG: hypothetical protein A3J07_04880 [Candid